MAPSRDAETLQSRDPEGMVATETRTPQSESTRTRIRRTVNRVFSPKAYLLVLVTAAIGFVVGQGLIPLPVASGFAGLLGITMAGFLVGLTGGPRRYLEAATAGATAAGMASLLDFFTLAVIGGLGLPLIVIGTIAGALGATVGLYFGRDLHAGLTREL